MARFEQLKNAANKRNSETIACAQNLMTLATQWPLAKCKAWLSSSRILAMNIRKYTEYTEEFDYCCREDTCDICHLSIFLSFILHQLNLYAYKIQVDNYSAKIFFYLRKEIMLEMTQYMLMYRHLPPPPPTIENFQPWKTHFLELTKCFDL